MVLEDTELSMRKIRIFPSSLFRGVVDRTLHSTNVKGLKNNLKIISESMSEIINDEVEATEQELQEVRRNHKQFCNIH